MWTARRGTIPVEICRALEQARDLGIANLDEIALLEAENVQLDANVCSSYFRENLHFQFGESEQQGLELFQSYAAMLGIVPVTHAKAISITARTA
jgi:hypothetical protein